MRRALLIAALVLQVGCRCDEPVLAAPAVTQWRELAPGLDYARVERSGTTFHALRASLEQFDVLAPDARREARKVATVASLRAEAKALAALNGTFFDEQLRPLGLLVSEGRELNPLRDISWWAAVVVTDDRRAALLTTSELKALDKEARSRIVFAMQVGPRTVADGQRIKLKKQVAARSAVCITQPDELVLLATEGAPVESNALSRVMATPTEEGGWGCSAGLMLDGGPSTQLDVAAGGFSLGVRGGWGVPNAIALRPRALPESASGGAPQGTARD